MKALLEFISILLIIVQVTAYTGSRTYHESYGVETWVIAVGNIAGAAVIIIVIIICCCALRRRRLQQEQLGGQFAVQYQQPVSHLGPAYSVPPPGPAYNVPPPPYSAVNNGYDSSHDGKANTNGASGRPNGTTPNPYSASTGVVLSPRNTEPTRTYNRPTGMQKYLADGYNYGP